MATGRLPDPNTAPLTAKGDLYTYSTRGDRLAVGSNGDTLVADSSATTGLRWQGNYSAGKNYIINGDFRINQRNFTSNTATGAYNFDRFTQLNGGGTGTLTITPQTFTLGSAPVAGYEARNFVQCVTASGASTDTYAIFGQKIESVRTLAGQTATISFWAKATSGTPKIGVELEQIFGTGGSPSATVNTAAGSVTISTSWARYSVTVAVPSISGKTIGTNSDDILNIYLWMSAGSTFAVRSSSTGLQNNTFQFWGIQVEQGSVATAFQTATGTLAGERSACERYYQRWDIANFSKIGTGVFFSSTAVFGCTIPPKVTFRATPTLSTSGLVAFDGSTSFSATIASNLSNSTQISFDLTVSGATALRAAMVGGNNNSNAYFEASAEL